MCQHDLACTSDARHGWLLVGLIILLTSALFAFAGFSLLLTHHLRVTSLRQNQTKAITLAQAGIMRALYDFRFDGPGGIGVDGNNFRLGAYDAVPGDAGAPGLADDDVFVLGGQAADFLLATMIPGTFATAGAGGACGSTARHRLQGWTLRNVLISNTPPDGMTISFSQMAVSWSPVVAGVGEGFVRIDLRGTGSDWTAPACAPQPLGTIVNLSAAQTITPASPSWGTNRIWFAPTSDMNATTKDWIELAFFMSDGSVRRVRFLPSNTAASSANFTIKSYGEVRQGVFPFTVWRRLQAEYRMNPADPSNLQAVGRLTTDAALLVNPPVPTAYQRPGYKELTQQVDP